jgi:4,5-dihydroxyphthalate decarboxylase
MANLRLSLSSGDYDRTRPLIEGAVQAPGLDLTVIPLPSAERHQRFVRRLEFDACELQVAQYLGLKSRGAPLMAIPVFPHRRFNHSSVMVRTAAGIERPEDLAGRRVGIHAWHNPIALWVRGVLQHDHGVGLGSIHWVADGAEDVPDWTPPDWLHIERAPAGQTAERLLEAGALDATMVADVGVTVSADGPTRRLWPNYRAVEQDYYRRTRIFPIRHLVVVKEEVLRRDPWVAASLVRAFEDAKRLAYRYWADHRRSSLAWFGAEQEEERALLGADPWAYSIAANRIVLDTLLDYAAEQRITDRRLAVEEVFAPGTLD